MKVGGVLRLISRVALNAVATEIRFFPCFSRGMFTLPESSKSAYEDTTKFPFFLPHFPRNASYSKVSDLHISKLRSLLYNPSIQLIESCSEILPYCTDWLKIFRSLPLHKATMETTLSRESCSFPLVILPHTTKEVSEILAYCDSNLLAVCPQGGNTGLVGGSVPVFDEILVNLSKMNKIISFDVMTGVLICEAGCVLSDLENFLKSQETKYIMPLDLGAKGSCQIGGNISTNAGGTRFIRYGNLAGNVLGLEVVLADGTVLDCLTSLKKDNTGLKLHQLFIGSEGFLGVVTKVAIQCILAPTSVQVCLMTCASFSDILKASLLSKKHLPDIISALEFFDFHCIQNVLNHIPSAVNILNIEKKNEIDEKECINSPSFYLLLETHGQNTETDRSRVMSLVDDLISSEIVQDGLWPDSVLQADQIWLLRESISAAMSHQGKVYKYDLTLPLEKMYKIVEDTRKKLYDSGFNTSTVGYGHLGDCNLHMNILSKNYQQFNKLEAMLDSWVYDYVKKIGGSISAEHGLGLTKAEKIEIVKPQEYIQLLKKFKALFDPRAILNPYKFYRASV